VIHVNSVPGAETPATDTTSTSTSAEPDPLLHHQQRNSDNWPQTRRTGIEQLAITKLQLFCLDWTMNWNVILPKFRHHLMLSVEWVS